MRILFTTAAVAALALTAAACNKPASDSANVQAGSTNGTSNAVASAQAAGSDIVDKVQDSAAAVVGPISAATAGSLSAQAFVENAARSDMYEIQSSELAQQRSKSAAIKKYAAMMIKAHTATSAELNTLISGGKAGADVKLPVALDERRQGLVDNLKSASDSDFDARYVDQQAAAHRETAILMDGYGAAGSNADLKAMAKKTAPKVKAHLNMVEGLDKTNADKDKPGTEAGKAKS